jgi:hypothetical protein
VLTTKDEEKPEQVLKKSKSHADDNRKSISQWMAEIATKDFLTVTKELCERYREIIWLTSKTEITPEGIIIKSVFSMHISLINIDAGQEQTYFRATVRTDTR